MTSVGYSVRKDDTVRVITGDDSGKTGKVLRVFPDRNRIIVEKVNVVKRHLKKGHPQAQQGGIIEKESTIHISNVMLVCKQCGKPTRTKKKELADGKRARVCILCGEFVDKV